MPKWVLAMPNNPNTQAWITVIFRLCSRYNNDLKFGIRVNTNAITSNIPILSNKITVISFNELLSLYQFLFELLYKIVHNPLFLYQEIKTNRELHLRNLLELI